MKVHVAVISSGRPANVAKMAEHLGDLGATWYVGAGEADTYRQAGHRGLGHHTFVESGPLCASRNAALDDAAAEGAACLQLSDDLRRIGWAEGTTRDSVQPLTMTDALARLAAAMDAEGAHLAGCAPTDNPYFAKPRVHRSAFIVGDLVLVRAGCPLRFDEQLCLKEDYDYTLQHLATYGVVARVDQLLATFVHRSNPGGAVAVRTPEVEQEAIARLQMKWPGHIRPNPKRANEVLLRW